MGVRAWLLSAYGAASHRAWARALIAGLPRWQWRAFELPGRHFAWRIRGNPLSWIDALDGPAPALIVATSMVDLATLKGLQPRLARVPALYYFHENQFAYPPSPDQVRSLEPQMVQLYGALAASRVGFNSAFNRDSFLEGVAELLAAFPDAVPTGIPERLARKSVLLPVPVSAPAAAGRRDPRLILWNHRWEYDKAPEVFAEALERLKAAGVEFRVALLGARGHRRSPALERIRGQLPERIVADGHQSVAAYRAWLGRAAVVVSTARHEFQGLAVLEAAGAGARPLVPDALCYREQFPPDYRYPPDDAVALAGRLVAWLDGGLPPPVDVSAWARAAVMPRWQAVLESIARPGEE